MDPGAQRLLREARQVYRDTHSSERLILKDNKALLILPWAGDLAQNALVLLLRSLGLETAQVVSAR
jgi:hypothetical protein